MKVRGEVKSAMTAGDVAWSSLPYAQEIELNVEEIQRVVDRLFYPNQIFISTLANNGRGEAFSLPDSSESTTLAISVAREKSQKGKTQRLSNSVRVQLPADQLRESTNDDIGQYVKALDQELRAQLKVLQRMDAHEFFKEYHSILLDEAITTLYPLLMLEYLIEFLGAFTDNSKYIFNPLFGMILNFGALLFVSWSKRMAARSGRTEEQDEDEGLEDKIEAEIEKRIKIVPQEIQNIQKGNKTAFILPLALLSFAKKEVGSFLPQKNLMRLQRGPRD